MDPNTSRQTDTQWQRRHREILDISTRLFTVRGFAGTTMQMIAKATDSSVGYLYKHFPGKRELLSDVIRKQIETYAQIRRDVRRAHDRDPAACLRTEIRELCAHLMSQPGLLAIFKAQPVLTRGLHIPLQEKFRREDSDLFKRILEERKIDDADPALLAAVYRGMVFSLVELIFESERLDRLSEIPDIIDEIFLTPLLASGSNPKPKDETL